MTCPLKGCDVQGPAHAAPAPQHGAQAALAPFLLLEARPLAAPTVIGDKHACLQDHARVWCRCSQELREIGVDCKLVAGLSGPSPSPDMLLNRTTSRCCIQAYAERHVKRSMCIYFVVGYRTELEPSCQTSRMSVGLVSPSVLCRKRTLRRLRINTMAFDKLATKALPAAKASSTDQLGCIMHTIAKITADEQRYVTDMGSDIRADNTASLVMTAECSSMSTASALG